MDEKHVESDSEPSSDVSYSESTDNDEQGKKQSENESLQLENSQIGKTNNAHDIAKISHELEELQVKDIEEK